MRRRSASVFWRSDPVSTTWTTPYDVSMARSAAAPRIPRPRSRVEDILRQEGGHHEVGDIHHVAEPEVDGHAAELSAEPTLLQETHHAEDGVAPGQVEILTLVDPRLRHGHTHGGGVLSGPVCCQTSRPTVAGRCGVVNRLDNLCRHPTRSTPTRMLAEAAARWRSALGHAIHLSILQRTAGTSPKQFEETPDSERRRHDRSVSSRRFATRSSPVTASGGDAEGRYARTPMLKILVTDKEGPMHSRSSALATVVVLSVVLLLAPAAQSADLTWTPYDRPAQYATVVDKEVPIMMRDGVVLNADISRPDAPGQYPVLITMTPYSKAIAGEAPGYLIARGYVHVAVDVRGQGRSGGTWCNRCEIEQMDGYEVVQWADAQAWSH